MRILLVTETLAAGGAETFVVRLAGALRAAGHDVMIAVAVPVVNPAVRAAIAPGVAVEVIPLPRWRWWSKAESAFRKIGVTSRPLHRLQRRWLERLVVRFRPDAIHSHLLKADLLAHDARAATPGARHVITIHGDYPAYLSGTADPFLKDAERHMRALAADADAIVGVAAEHLDLFRDRLGAKSERLHLIYNGYDLPRGKTTTREALGLPEYSFLFGMVARGIEAKGWSEAIEAFALLGRNDAALVLVGDGPYLTELRRNAVPANVHFAGFSSDPVSLIRHFDVGLLPSRAEALPTVIIEYLMCGVPVIASDVGEVAAMLRTGDGNSAGMAMELENGAVPPERLAEAMARVMDDPDLRARQAASAKDAARKFAMPDCVAAYEALFRAPPSSPNKARH